MIRAIAAAPAPTSAPTIARQPESQSVASGGTVVFSVEASANAAAYQWKRNGAAIPGAGNALLSLANITAANAGTYTVDVSNAAGTVTSSACGTGVGAAADPGRITNFSIRSNAGTGAQTLIVGLAIDGAATASGQTLLLRGIGPTLSNFGCPGRAAGSETRALPRRHEAFRKR